MVVCKLIWGSVVICDGVDILSLVGPDTGFRSGTVPYLMQCVCFLPHSISCPVLIPPRFHGHKPGNIVCADPSRHRTTRIIRCLKWVLIQHSVAATCCDYHRICHIVARPHNNIDMPCHSFFFYYSKMLWLWGKWKNLNKSTVWKMTTLESK